MGSDLTFHESVPGYSRRGAVNIKRLPEELTDERIFTNLLTATLDLDRLYIKVKDLYMCSHTHPYVHGYSLSYVHTRMLVFNDTTSPSTLSSPLVRENQ